MKLMYDFSKRNFCLSATYDEYVTQKETVKNFFEWDGFEWEMRKNVDAVKACEELNLSFDFEFLDKMLKIIEQEKNKEINVDFLTNKHNTFIELRKKFSNLYSIIEKYDLNIYFEDVETHKLIIKLVKEKPELVAELDKIIEEFVFPFIYNIPLYKNSVRQFKNIPESLIDAFGRLSLVKDFINRLYRNFKSLSDMFSNEELKKLDELEKQKKYEDKEVKKSLRYIRTFFLLEIYKILKNFFFRYAGTIFYEVMMLYKKKEEENKTFQNSLSDNER